MTDFNQANWATITTGYLSSIKKKSKSNSIIKAAKSFLKATSRTAGDTAFLSAEQETTMDERAFLCDDPKSDGDSDPLAVADGDFYGE